MPTSIHSLLFSMVLSLGFSGAMKDLEWWKLETILTQACLTLLIRTNKCLIFKVMKYIWKTRKWDNSGHYDMLSGSVLMTQYDWWYCLHVDWKIPQSKMLSWNSTLNHSFWIPFSLRTIQINLLIFSVS